MTGQALLVLCGLGVGIGLLILTAAWRGATPASLLAWRRRPRERRAYAGRWALAAAGAGLAALVVTGWIVGAALAVVAVWQLPRLLSATAAARQTVERLDAIAAWTEMLRDTLAAGAGLEQTITATAPTAPAAIRPQILTLAQRLGDGERLAPALRRLSVELDDPTADLVIAALILSSEHQARHLGARLGALAATAREQVEMRQRVEASRSRIRTTVRIVTGTTAAFIAALLVFNRAFLTPYDTPAGQGMLLLVGGVFAVALVWLARLSRFEEPERFLAAEPQPLTPQGDTQGVVR